MNDVYPLRGKGSFFNVFSIDLESLRDRYPFRPSAGQAIHFALMQNEPNPEASGQDCPRQLLRTARSQHDMLDAHALHFRVFVCFNCVQSVTMIDSCIDSRIVCGVLLPGGRAVKTCPDNRERPDEGSF